jgi:DNA-3-methyladenine glycosylase I
METAERKTRCGWAGADSLYVSYHDEEWGVPLRDDRRLFEFLVLEGAQAGLSWLTILRKRENYRVAFDAFDPRRVAQYGADEVDRLMGDAGIVRNRRKIESAIGNACAVLSVQNDWGSFDRFVWSFVGGSPIQNRWRDLAQVPAETEESRAFSRECKRLGFRFVGPTICYAFMQAVGMVNDHLVDCFRHGDLS